MRELLLLLVLWCSIRGEAIAPAPTQARTSLRAPAANSSALFFAPKGSLGPDPASTPAPAPSSHASQRQGPSTTPAPLLAPGPSVRRSQLYTQSSTPVPLLQAAIGSADYNSSLPPWPTTYNSAQLDAQRSAGSQLLQDIANAVAEGNSSYTIPPGLYRTAEPIQIEATLNFTINAAGVELVSEDGSLHFRLYNNTNFSLQGPITLDGDPFGFTQGVVEDTDNSSYIAIRMMPNYPPPKPDKRIMLFTAAGAMLPLYQINIQEVQPQGDDLYHLIFPEAFFTTYPAAVAEALQPGNLMSMETGELNGGINMESNDGVQLSDVTFHTAELVFALRERGLISIDSLRGVRRPGTSRLNGGGWCQMLFEGGSLFMTDSELSYNFDDLTNFGSSLGYAFNQVSPTEVYIGFNPDAPPIGAQLHLYDAATLESHGTAKIVASVISNDTDINQDYLDALTGAQVLNWNVTPSLVTLSAPVNISALDLVDYEQGRPSSIIVQNSYFHDSLASGINAKGAKSIRIFNNIVARSGYRGIGVGFDPYWSEGGIPQDITIEGNVVANVPYNLVDDGQSITIYVDSSTALLSQATASPIKAVKIVNNTVLNSPIAGIGVEYASGVVILNNTLSNPVSAKADYYMGYAQPFVDASAIFLNVVGNGTVVEGNIIYGVDPQIVPQVVRASSRTDPQSVSLCGNTMRLSSGGALQPLPDELYTKIYSDELDGGYPKPWLPANYTGVGGDRLNSQFTFYYTYTAGQAATFVFNGTRGRFYTSLGPSYGMAQIVLDGKTVSVLDASIVPAGFTPEANTGVSDQMVYDSGELPYGEHTLQVVVAGEPGSQSRDNLTAVAIGAFDYLEGNDPFCGQLT